MKKKILIVDDEDDVRSTVGSILSNAGYEVIAASNGKDAALLARKERPNLILLDIRMPEMDGALTTDILKNDASTSDIPIIYLSGLVKEKELEDGEGHVFGSKIGDVHFVPKDQPPEKLLETVKKYLK